VTYAAIPATYANWGQRVAAYLIDIVPIAVIVIIGSATRSLILLLLFALIALVVNGYNRWYMAGTTGQSWGKKALHLNLVYESNGEPTGTGIAFARDICHILDSLTCYIGWLWPIWDAKRQTFADKIVSTVVPPA
jgi:uncharacterized RDD family membrane protein YckC